MSISSRRPRASQGESFARKCVSIPPETMKNIDKYLSENPDLTLSKFFTEAAEQLLKPRSNGKAK